MDDPRTRSLQIKAKALELGFLACGVARADRLAEEESNLERWLRAGHNGQMDWMARNVGMRLDPRELVPGAKSVVSLAYNYFTGAKQADPDAPKLSMYAFGRDYHKVVKQRMKPLMAFIKEQYGDVAMRCFTDSAPILEKAWAQKAGIGWRGKHTLVIRQGQGSYFFLGEIVLDLDLEPDAPATDHCGTCTRCIDACPTEAITPYGLISNKCITYNTIELKGPIPGDAGDFRNWAFGCDICQQVCPWNRFSTPHHEPDFAPRRELMELTADEWHALSEERYERLFFGSPVKRAKYGGLMRNLAYLRARSGPSMAQGSADR